MVGRTGTHPAVIAMTLAVMQKFRNSEIQKVRLITGSNYEINKVKSIDKMLYFSMKLHKTFYYNEEQGHCPKRDNRP